MKKELFMRKFKKIAMLSNGCEIFEETDAKTKQGNGVIKIYQRDNIGCLYSDEINTNFICKEEEKENKETEEQEIINKYLEYYSELESELYLRACSNFREFFEKVKREGGKIQQEPQNLKDALKRGFNWRLSKEGYSYWLNVHENLK